jgi:hypothetical protein
MVSGMGGVSGNVKSAREVVDLSNSDRIRVVVRCRPRKESESVLADTVQFPDNESISVKMATGRPIRNYKFDFVTGVTCQQETIFEQAGRPVVDCAMAGFNGTIFAYGQTGSGKTHTMSGPPGAKSTDSVDERGVVPRACEAIFDHIAEHASDEITFKVSASYIEIYNEKIRDLLDIPNKQMKGKEEQKKRFENASENGAKLPINDSHSKEIYLQETASGEILVEGGRSWVKVTTEDECIKVFAQGSTSRSIGKTAMNAESSRSHAIFTISVKQTSTRTMKERVSQLHLVDLAGSERQKSSQATGRRLKEANEINKSLTSLGTVIQALVDSAHQKGVKRRHIPYRDSKLTFLLKDALGGNSKTCLIATVSPAYSSLSETGSTLEFAKRCSAIKNIAMINENLTSDTKELQEEVRRLRAIVKKLEKKSLSTLSRNISQPDVTGVGAEPSPGGYNDNVGPPVEKDIETSLAEREEKRAQNEAMPANDKIVRPDAEAARADEEVRYLAAGRERIQRAERLAEAESRSGGEVSNRTKELQESNRTELLQVIVADALSREEHGKTKLRQAAKRNDKFVELVERQEKSIAAVSDVVQLRDSAMRDAQAKKQSRSSGFWPLRQEIELIKVQLDSNPETARLPMELTHSKADLKSSDASSVFTAMERQRNLQGQHDLLNQKLEASLIQTRELREVETPVAGKENMPFGSRCDCEDGHITRDRDRSEDCYADVSDRDSKNGTAFQVFKLKRQDSEVRNTKVNTLLTSLRASVQHLEESIASVIDPMSIAGIDALRCEGS